MKQTNNDIYNLNSTSPKGEIGFEPFRTDKHYYFHFNNEEGDCILFSQAYKSKRGADNGMESIKKNIRYKDHVILHHDDDLHYFTIKAGNNQEVARSRNFDTFEDMEKGLHFLYTHLGCTYEPQYANNVEPRQLEELAAKNESLSNQLKEKNEIETELREKLWELETALAETTSSLNESLLKQEEWEQEKANLEEKLVLLTKKMSDLDHSHLTEQPAIEEFQGSTYGFRIDFYNIDTAEDVKVTIYQPLSREKKVMKGLQKDAIFEFITKRLPTTILAETIEEEFDKIAVKTVDENSKHIVSRGTTTTVATKRAPAIQEIREPAKLAVTVEEIVPELTAIDEEITPIIETVGRTTDVNKKVRTIYQMKAMVEEIRKKMATKELLPKPEKQVVTPPPNPEEVAIQKSTAEIAMIEQFFGSTDTENLSTKEELEPVAYLTTEVEQTIDEAAAAEETIRQFFPPKSETEIESRTISRAATPVSTATTELSADELEVIERFFSFKNEPRTSPLKLSEIQNLLDNAMDENPAMSPEDQAMIGRFFPENSVAEEISKSRKVENKLVLKTQKTCRKAELEKITQFFGKKEKIEVKATEDKIVASILSNIKEDATVQPVNKELVTKFFGKQKKEKKAPMSRKVATNSKSKSKGKAYQFNQQVCKSTGREDIALFNKLFGK